MESTPKRFWVVLALLTLSLPLMGHRKGTCIPRPEAPVCEPAAEVCNGVDDDCNGIVDDGLVGAATTCGLGECAAAGAMECVGGAWVDTCAPLPGVNEVCGDGRDNDCDGKVDEDCGCPRQMVLVSDADTLANGAPAVATWAGNLRWTAAIPGATWIWDEEYEGTPVEGRSVTFVRNFTLPADAYGVSGTLTVAADNSYLCWLNDGAFVLESDSEFNYFAENVATAALDAALFAGPNELVCIVTNWPMADGTAEINPGGLLFRLEVAYETPISPEVCDGADNDCDGAIDNGLPVTATACGVGACAAAGELACVDGVWFDSCAPGAPSDEACDGIDNDCDGVVDNDQPVTATACGVGACAAAGELACVDGAWLDSCTPGAPSAELCDGIDNDCDGVVDNDQPVTATACGVGACAAVGELACLEGVWVDSCTPGEPQAEVCDGRDNDCDGAADQGLPATATSCGVGECAAVGELACVAGAWVDSCAPGDPVDEICFDGRDNNCDGAVDEDCTCPQERVFVSDSATLANGAPAVATWTGNARWTAQVEGATWIWDAVYEPTPRVDRQVVFTRMIELPADAMNLTGSFEVAADNSYHCTLNDPAVLFASPSEFNYFDEYVETFDVSSVLVPGANFLTCAVLNWGQPGGSATSNPGGLLYRLEVAFDIPLVAEVCDGYDNDCDGVIDNDLPPVDVACGVGACAATGTLTCTGGAWVDSCVPGAPSAEVCDGVDNDCDGEVDNGLPVTDTTCGVGACAANGTLACVDGAWLDSCAPGAPAAEECDGVDNDCDGVADNGLPVTDTACGLGACAAAGVLACVDGVWFDSCAPGAPSDEVCDLVDNDCDGVVDNGLPATDTECGVGACYGVGELACIDGVWVNSCLPGEPSPEVCDLVDNDCDGLVDNGLSVTPTACGVGACAATGVHACVDGAWVDSCTPGAPAEEVCDLVDNDCDGAVDNGLSATPTTCGVGACAATGELACVDGAWADSCTPGAPGEELCDLVDNDCDGLVDNDLPVTLTSCGIGACAADGELVCVDGEWADTCAPGEPVAEVCDGLDNDCDGVWDEDLAVTPTTCGVGACAADGELLCIGGAWVDTCAPGLPVAELCDGLDNDCDGAVDEGFALGQPCRVGGCGPDVDVWAVSPEGAPLIARSGNTLLTGSTLACNFEHPYAGVAAYKQFFVDSANLLTGGAAPYVLYAYGAWDAPDEGAMEVLLDQMAIDGDLADFEVWDVSAVTPFHLVPGDLDGVDLVVLDAAPDTSASYFAITPSAGQVLRDFVASGGKVIGSAYVFVHWYGYTAYQYGHINAEYADLFGGVLPDLTAPAVATAVTTELAPGGAGQQLVTLIGAEPWRKKPADPFFHEFWRLIVQAPIPTVCVAEGVTVCAADGLSVVCDAALPIAGPELCGNGFDDDCDCEVDEGFEALGTACVLGRGECASEGVFVCSDDLLDLVCDAAAIAPVAEECDGLDNDCDGTVDNDLPVTATSCGVGACAAAGETACVDGAWADSCVPGTPVAELCNGADDDCNGIVDDGFDVGGDCLIDPCGYGTGAVAVLQPCVELGVLACAADGSLACVGTGCRLTTVWQLGVFDLDVARAEDGATEYPANGQHYPMFVYDVVGAGDESPELPAYLSDRPLSEIDPSRPQTDSTAELHVRFILDEPLEGARLHWSRYGSETNLLFLGVSGGSLIGGGVTPLSGETSLLLGETAFDEGGHGFVDIALPPLAAGAHVLRFVYAGGGADNGNYLDALRLVAPVCGPLGAELCLNGLDDNCNCQIDEGFENVGAPCSDGVGACVSEGVFVCSDDLRDTVCAAPVIAPTAEVCDGLDNDCNGVVDDGLEPTATTCGVGACAATGQLVCESGAWVDTCEAGDASAEVCDGVDNDCNGIVDDGLAGVPLGTQWSGHAGCADGVLWDRTVCVTAPTALRASVRTTVQGRGYSWDCGEGRSNCRRTFGEDCWNAPSNCTCQDRESVCVRVDGVTVFCTADWNGWADPAPGVCNGVSGTNASTFTLPVGSHRVQLVHAAWLDNPTCANPQSLEVDFFNLAL